MCFFSIGFLPESGVVWDVLGSPADCSPQLESQTFTLVGAGTFTCSKLQVALPAICRAVQGSPHTRVSEITSPNNPAIAFITTATNHNTNDISQSEVTFHDSMVCLGLEVCYCCYDPLQQERWTLFYSEACGILIYRFSYSGMSSELTLRRGLY